MPKFSKQMKTKFTINSKTNSKTNSSTSVRICIVILVLVIIILFAIFVILYRNNHSNHSNQSIHYNKDKFEESQPQPTPTPSGTKSSKDIVNEEALKGQSAPEMKKKVPCSANEDIVGICLDYDNCCISTENSSCLCSNPIIKKCKDEYTTCINDADNIKLYTPEQLLTNCIDKNKACCTPYNKISISSDKFTKGVKREQTDNVLCNVSNIKNVDAKCLELCQTHPQCAAYSSNLLKCTLFTKVSDYKAPVDPITGSSEENTKTNFYVKK